MLNKVELASKLGSLARIKARDYDMKTVPPLLVEKGLTEGWSIDKENDKSVRLKRKKHHNVLLEDRVWTLLFRMGFKYLSEDGGSYLLVNPKELNSPKTQIDVVGIDDEVAIAFECKSAEKRTNRPQFQEELGKHSLIRERFVNAINVQFNSGIKRQIILSMFTSNISLSDNDRARASQANIVLFDEQDLVYYESLVAHLGPAARYQLLADMIPGKKVPGLSIRVPAVKTKMGGANCYTFSISPEFLLKISYVSHRSKGKMSEINTYQRMISKSRLSKIKEYISDNGIFPTNIVLNIERGHVRFEKIKQECDNKTDTDIGILGWLILQPTYKSAWIIDGQHRLFAYSGHDKAAKAHLSVLAFEGLAPSKQARLFIDINAKQKSVKASLLQELYAELHWDADEPEKRIRAILSKAIQELGADPDSALYQRIQTADISKTDKCCITLNSIYTTLEKKDFHIVKVKNGSPIEYGPLWAGSSEATLKRTTYILKNWLNTIANSTREWWDKGAGEGGGLAMSDGIITCINVLRSVFQYLDTKGNKLVHLDNEDLFDCIKPYVGALGQYLGELNEVDRRKFRDLRGIQGQTTRTRRCQQAIKEKIPNFDVLGLDDFIKLEKAQTNAQAKTIIDWIETNLQELVINLLKQSYGSAESEWWIHGIPKIVRTRVSDRFEQDDGKRGGKEYYFELLDYKKIILEDWAKFEPVLAFGNSGNKEKRTSWIDYISQRRNIVAHPSSAITITFEELDELQKYRIWLSEKLQGK